MKAGDFVSVHFEDGCIIGTLSSIEGDTVSVTFGTITGEHMTMRGIPKKFCSLYMSRS